MIIVGVVGLVLGMLINQLVDWQVTGAFPFRTRPVSAIPLLGAIHRRNWLALAVEATTAAMAIVLWQQYGWSVRFVLLLAAALVLIQTAALDWRVRLIDTLVMIGATLVALVCAPLLVTTWTGALLGVIGTAIAFVLLFMLARLLYPQQHAPFGLGDVYLAMFIGALLGIGHVGAALLYGIVLAGVASVLLIMVYGYRRARHMPIAYGAFLCLGVLIYLAMRPLA